MIEAEEIRINERKAAAAKAEAKVSKESKESKVSKDADKQGAES